jgi:hypothetical protein
MRPAAEVRELELEWVSVQALVQVQVQALEPVWAQASERVSAPYDATALSSRRRVNCLIALRLTNQRAHPRRYKH